jgi:hypothetical protein
MTARRPTRGEVEFTAARTSTDSSGNGSYDLLPPRPSRDDRTYKHERRGTAGGDCEPSVFFAKGTQSGRAGRPNKFNQSLKQQILDAAAACRHSKDGTLLGFLVHCANEHTAAYLRVLSKLIPYHWHLQAHMQFDSTQDIRAQLIAKGVPLPPSLFKMPVIPERPRQDPPEPPRPLVREAQESDRDAWFQGRPPRVQVAVDNTEGENDEHDDSPPQAAE